MRDVILEMLLASQGYLWRVKKIVKSYMPRRFYLLISVKNIKETVIIVRKYRKNMIYVLKANYLNLWR